MKRTAVAPVLVLVLGLGLYGAVARAQPVEAFSVVSDSLGPLADDGRNRLQWVTPVGAAVTDTFIIKFRTAATQCQLTDYPSDPLGADPSPPGIPSVVPDGAQSLEHTGLTLDQWYCYSIWVYDGVSTYDGPATMKGCPSDTGGAVKWKYFAGTTTLAAPTVAFDAVIAPSNDNHIHAMQRDPLSAGRGAWPAGYRPPKLESPVQHRAPVVPRAGGGWQALAATQGGWVHAVDVSTGSVLWSTPLPEGAAQGSPAAMFTAFGGAYDYVLVGSSAGSAFNHLYALDPFTGAVIDSYPQAGDPGFNTMGPILGMPTVDYANLRVYFASRANGPTIWGLDLGPPPDALTSAWAPVATNDIDGSVVLVAGRVYAGTVGNPGNGVGQVWSVDASDGSSYLTTLDGAVRGFLFPDRRGPDPDLYAATQGSTVDRVEALTDTGSLVPKWPSEPVLDNPSIVLYHPGTDDIYVGVADYDDPFLPPVSDPVTPAIVKISAADGSVVSYVDLESFTFANVVGAPTLDVYGGILYVGSEAGIIYAVSLAAF